MKRLVLMSFLASNALGFALAAPSSAAAKWQRISPTHCQVQAFFGYYPIVGMGAAKGLEVDDDTGLPAYLMCNIDDSNTYSKAEVSTLKVHVIDHSSSWNAEVRACRMNYSDTGGACGPSVSTSGSSSGIKVLRPSTSMWGTAGMGYVWVAIPPKSGSSTSSLVGIYTSDS